MFSGSAPCAPYREAPPGQEHERGEPVISEGDCLAVDQE